MRRLYLLIGLLLWMWSCGGSGGSKAQTNPPATSIISLLISPYFYPLDYQQEYERLLSLQTTKEVIVVLNPDNGPGYRKDENFERTIASLKAKGYKVLGYLKMRYGNKGLQELKDEMNRYLQFYPAIDGFLCGIFGQGLCGA